jgi:hypothetical protein
LLTSSFPLHACIHSLALPDPERPVRSSLHHHPPDTRHSSNGIEVLIPPGTALPTSRSGRSRPHLVPSGPPGAPACSPPVHARALSIGTKAKARRRSPQARHEPVSLTSAPLPLMRCAMMPTVASRRVLVLAPPATGTSHAACPCRRQQASRAWSAWGSQSTTIQFTLHDLLNSYRPLRALDTSETADADVDERIGNLRRVSSH